MPTFRMARGSGWIWWIGALEIALLGLQAMPNLLPTPAAVAEGRRAAAPVTTPERARLQPIVDFQPFGMTAPPAADPPPATADAPLPPVTSLVLQGILLGDDGASAHVLLSSDGGPGKIYVVGDTLPGGGVLSGVEPDRIWIDLDGDKQILGFPVAQNTQGMTDSDPPESDRQTQDPLQPDLRQLIPGLVADPTDQP